MKKFTVDEPIVIGDVKINPIDYAIRATANLGIKETGKSYAAGYFAEQLMKRGIPITVISPSPGRVWRHLKIGRPGFEGFPVVVVGDDEDADLPISKNTAADIMRAAMQEGVSVVFDVFSKNLTKSDFRGIVKEVTQVLLFENENYGLRHVFLEECGDLIPQKVYDKVTYAAVEQLIRVGGNSGVGVTILNPRAEGVNKEALELCEHLLLFKQTGRNSIANLQKWLKNVDAGNQDEVIRSLAKLGPGDCWFWDATDKPPLRMHIPEKDTVHPDRRQLVGKSVITKTGTDVSTFVARMNKVLEKQKKDEVKEILHPAMRGIKPGAAVLHGTESISRLESTISNLTNENARLNALAESRLEDLKVANQKITEVTHKMEIVRDMLKPDYERLQKIFGEVVSSNGSESIAGVDRSKYEIWFPRLIGKQRDMLNILIERKKVTLHQLRVLIGMSDSGTFGDYHRGLVKLGLARLESGTLYLEDID